MAAILQGGKRDLTGQTPSFAITNHNEDLALNCDSTTDAELADVLGTVIRELIRKGILNGTVA